MKNYKFKIKNDWNQFLNQIFKNIDNDSYIWKVYNDEVFNKNNDFLFKNDIIENKVFWETINSDIYYIIFLNLELYQDSNLLLKLEIVDCEFVSLNVYNENLVSQIEYNLKNNI